MSRFQAHNNPAVYDEKDLGGLMQFVRCPDCHWALRTLTKITENGAEAKKMAKACLNPACWRYLKLSDMITWKLY